MLVMQRDTLLHRGPDDCGVWVSDDGGVGLAHRRLSILDLSSAGRQPLASTCGRLQLVFNGEIYNFAELRERLVRRGHSFHTRTDTEVVLEAYRAWGERCVRELRGMFAFALWDAGERCLLIARDHAGQKPLFYHHARGRLAFASELKALLADPESPREMDPHALETYLAYGYVPGSDCLLAGVHKLPQGHALRYYPDRDHLRVEPYWTLPDPATGSGATPEELERELESLLESSVAEQLVSDVPVGVLLSGGIDSSLVTALAARVSSGPLRTFTVTFPGNASHDEGPFARIIADHFATEHTELVAEAASVELLPLLARQYDEPLADSSMVPTYLVSRLIREHATVALGGDGGDELFGGYPHHAWVHWQAMLRNVLPGPVRAGAAAVGRRLPVGLRGRNHLAGLGGDFGRYLAHINLFFDASTRDKLLRPIRGMVPPGIRPEDERARLSTFGHTPLQRSTALDFRTYLPDDILVKVDRASMLTSLEVRSPFLDHRIVELAFGRVPDRLRATSTARKILPKRLAARLLPSDVDLRRKQGFSLPLNDWLRGEWGAYVESVLLGSPPELFDSETIRRLIRGQREGRSNAPRLFSLVMLELWRREYDVDIAT